MTELCISQELNVPRKDFGSTAWRLVLDKVPFLRLRLEADIPLVDVSYTDRYLRSPLAVILLNEWIQGLTRFSGGLEKNTKLNVTTSRIERNDLFDPRWLHQDWRDSTDRLAAFEVLFKPMGQFNYSEKVHSDLPHARELRLKWADGFVWVLRLDQGFGYWRTALRHPFPFDQSKNKQMIELKSTLPRLEASSLRHPTYWYVLQEI